MNHGASSAIVGAALSLWVTACQASSRNEEPEERPRPTSLGPTSVSPPPLAKTEDVVLAAAIEDPSVFPRDRAGSATLPRSEAPELTPPTDPAPPSVAPPPPDTSAKSQPEATREPFALVALTTAEQDHLGAGSEDAPIEVTTHYIQSNETRHDLYFPYIENVGGTYIGVGSDQNYTLAARARSEFVFLMDIDIRIIDLHRIYHAFILDSATPDELVEHWSQERREESIAKLKDVFGDTTEDELRRLVRGFRGGRETVYRHLQRVHRRNRNGAGSTWLSNPEMYQHVRALYQADRVRIMIGNLTGSASLLTIANATSQLASPVRVFYVSNAEEYFKYTGAFATNVRSLPIDDRSVLLRTIHSAQWEHADLWAYQVQPLADLCERLADRRNRSRNPMLQRALYDGSLERDLGIEGFSRLGYRPKPQPTASPTATVASPVGT